MSSRQSYVTTRTGSPLAADLERLADSVEEFSDDVAAGMPLEKIAARLLLLASDLRAKAKVAESMEDLAAREMEARHG